MTDRDHDVERPADGAQDAPLRQPVDDFPARLPFGPGHDPGRVPITVARRPGRIVLARQAGGVAPGSRAPAPTLRRIDITIGGNPVGETVTYTYPKDDGNYDVVPLSPIEIGVNGLS